MDPFFRSILGLFLTDCMVTHCRDELLPLEYVDSFTLDVAV